MPSFFDTDPDADSDSEKVIYDRPEQAGKST